MFQECLEFRLPYMRGSAKRIAAIADTLGRRLRFTTKERFSLSLAARYHDIGMIAIPDSLVLKPEKLTPDEEAVVRRHVEFSGQLLGKVFPDFPDALEAVWFHHERPDGRGPFGLTTVPQLAGIISLADTIDAMFQGRPHRPALPPEQIVQELKNNGIGQFASMAIAAFEETAEEIFSALRNATDAAPALATM